MRYPIAIETGDSKRAYEVVVPDPPGCFSAGDTLDEALINAREAILLHLEGLLDDGQSFPKPSTIEQLRSKRSYRDWTWAIVDVDVSELGGRPLESTLLCRGGFSARWMLTLVSRARRGRGFLHAALDAMRKPA
jgi:predicted RNase H-like HicB family nuclease